MSDRQKIEYNLSYTRLLAILNSELQNIWNHGMVTVSPQIAYIFVQKIHHAIWNHTVWIYTKMFVKSHAILRNPAILLTKWGDRKHCVIRNRPIPNRV